MALKHSLLVAFAALTFSSTYAGAGWGASPVPNPNHPSQPGRGPSPVPAPAPGQGHVPGYGGQEQRSIRLNTRVTNSTIDLRQALNLGFQYEGYSVESVIVDTRGSTPGTEMLLFLDGRIADRAFSPQGQVFFRVGGRAELGRDFSMLQLSVRGTSDLMGLTVNLSRPDRPGRPGNPGNPGYSEQVNINISRRMYGNDQLDLARYVDMNRYRGYRVEALEIDGTSLFNQSWATVSSNGYNQGQTLTFGPYRQIRGTSLNNVVLDRRTSLVVLTRGDMDIHNITLRLSRR